MLRIQKISREQAVHAIERGEFDPVMTMSSKNVAVVLTQGWCPQWHSMESWFGALDKELDLDIYYLVYDETDYFEEFLHFKEEILGNMHVPYVRYYRGGKLISQSNYVSKDRFLSIFNL